MTYEIIINILTVFISSGAAAGVVSLITLRKTKLIEESIRTIYEKKLEEYRSRRQKKEEMLSDLVGPVVMQLHRTSRAFNRYKEKNHFLEAEVLYKSNLAIRDIIMKKGYLFDPEFMLHIINLMEHCDAWIEEFEKNKDDSDKFIFAGPQGFPFPKDAEKILILMCEQLKDELYGDGFKEYF